MAIVVQKVPFSRKDITEDKPSLLKRLVNDRLIMQDSAKSYPNVTHSNYERTVDFDIWCKEIVQKSRTPKPVKRGDRKN